MAAETTTAEGEEPVVELPQQPSTNTSTTTNNTSNNTHSNNTNPFEVAEPGQDDTNNNNNNDDDEQSVHSAASIALRHDFIRLTTQPVTAAIDDDHDDHANNNNNNYYNNNNNNMHGDGYLALSSHIHAGTRQHAASLATAATTPRLLLVVIPLLCLVAHALFVVGQTAPMWRLSLTAQDISVWFNATDAISKHLFQVMNLDDETHVTLQHNTTVQTFTYGFAVQELWVAAGMPGVFLPRLAAVLLVIFSGIWPHLKLVLLQYSWWSTGYNRNPHGRTRMLGWLALLGKWSLADVLTVCVMVGVLNLEWTIVPQTVKEGILNHLETLLNYASKVWTVEDVCNKALHEDTANCKLTDWKCIGCKYVVKGAFHEPAWAEETGKFMVKAVETDGTGTVRLSVVGMDGIYFFCSAVILSVLLSVIVEWYNHKYVRTMIKEHRNNNQQRRGMAESPTSTGHHHHPLSLTLATEEETAPANSPSISSVSDNEDDASEPLLDAAARRAAAEPGDQVVLVEEPPGATAAQLLEPMELMDFDDQESVFSHMIQRTANSWVYKCFQCHLIIPMVTMAFVALAVFLPSMERRVGGAIPDLLKEILGVYLDKSYSFETLRQTCGAAGGMDLLLMATFGLFCVVGPLIRALLVVLVAMTKSSGETTFRIRSFLVAASNFLAAFCAWEVFLVALVMVELLMPSVTNTILNTPACQILSKDGSSCVRVRFERVNTAFACLVLGFLMVTGLAIHVSMEDSKERHMIEEGGGVVSANRRRRGRDAADLEADDGQYYVQVNNGDDNDNDDDVAADGGGVDPADPRDGRNANGNNVTTMIQEEVV